MLLTFLTKAGRLVFLLTRPGARTPARPPGKARQDKYPPRDPPRVVRTCYSVISKGFLPACSPRNTVRSRPPFCPTKKHMCTCAWDGMYLSTAWWEVYYVVVASCLVSVTAPGKYGSPSRIGGWVAEYLYTTSIQGRAMSQGFCVVALYVM